MAKANQSSDDQEECDGTLACRADTHRGGCANDMTWNGVDWLKAGE